MAYRRSHWFHTIMMSRGDLDRVFNNSAMKKRYIFEHTPDLLVLIRLRQDTQIRYPWHVPI